MNFLITFRRLALCAIALAGCLHQVRAAETAGSTRWPNYLERRTAEYDYPVPSAGTYDLPVIQAAQDGMVLSTNGQPVELHELMRGRIVVLSFIYTRCTDPRACMRATGVLSELQRRTRDDTELSDKLLLITLSFDPANDTPGVMARYGRVSLGYGKGAEWVFLTTRNQEELQPLLEAYGQRVDRRKKPSSAGPYQHPLRVYLIDQQQQIRNIYSYGLLDPRLVITDVRTLLHDGENEAAAQRRLK